MKFKTENLHTWVGALVFVLGMTFILASYASQGRMAHGNDGLTLMARFNAADGVTEGTPVTLAGVQVGAVSGIELNKTNFSAVVTMSVDEDVQIPLDSAVAVASDGVFGAKYLAVVPGADFEYMRDGEMFEFTQDAVIIEELLEKIVVAAENAREKRKNAAQGEGDQAQ